jgi:drug/metabolite transporter (DMT)-like permease
MGLMGLTKRPDRRFWFMLPIALGGCVLLVGTPQDGNSQFFGSVLSLLAAFLYACDVICVTKLRQRGAGTSTIMAAVTVVSTIFIFPLYAWHGFPLPQSGQTILMLLALVIVGQIPGARAGHGCAAGSARLAQLAGLARPAGHRRFIVVVFPFIIPRHNANHRDRHRFVGHCRGDPDPVTCLFAA